MEFQEAYFGRIEPRVKETTDVFELFEWLMEVNKETKKDKMLAFFSSAPNIAELEKLNDEDLRLAYCEALASSMSRSGKPIGMK